jgi:anti-sigma-K factor RskA
MSDSSEKDHEGTALTAAEYVLGVLGPAQRRAAERRLGRDAVFAREVAYWEGRLGGLADAVPEVAPPGDGWARIEAALARAGSAEPRPGIWQSLSFWRGLALGTSALAAACLAALIYVGAFAPSAAPLVAKLDAEGGQTGFVAAVSSSGGTLTIVPAALLSPQEQKAFELWLIPAGDKPHSLGLIDPDKPVSIKVPRDLLSRVNNEAVLAVSLEPPGGSPTGQPTGPVIANGKLAAL